MAKFLIAVWPFASHYFPLIAIAHALRDRGHTVAFYSGRAAAATLTGQGFMHFPFQSVDEAEVERLMFARDSYASGRNPLQLKALLRRWLLGTLPDQVRDLEPIVAEWQPDVIVSETSLWGPILVTGERAGLPVAVFSTVISCLLPGPEAAPFRPWPARPNTPPAACWPEPLQHSANCLRRY
ncbi:MAG: glycosyltransferase family 1 protein, partial [Oscillochloris sp.]|nr:glycosyltransferase family 1 protein [Oscillochloris sp.]